jgi:hypothetical protein
MVVSEKPRRVFTVRELRSDPDLVHASTALYTGVTIVNEAGKKVMSMSVGTPDRTCQVCAELPEFCESTEGCNTACAKRAIEAEDRIREVRDKVQDIIGWD